MPSADTAYVIGVIREREKDFLSADDYARLIGAGTIEEAVRVLAETAYGKWLGETRDVASALAALDEHLAQVHAWLGDAVLDVRIWQFVSARYDALNIARALLAYARGQELPYDLSPLGTIDHEVLQSSLWHNLGWEKMPSVWAEFCQRMKEGAPEKLNALTVAQEVEKMETRWRGSLAITPLLREIDAHKLARQAANERRPFGREDDGSKFEKEEDEKLLAILKKYRLAPTGYDPIVSYWYGKELEVKQLRILLVAKLNQIPVAEMAGFRRINYREL